MTKKRIALVLICVFALSFVLFFPFPTGTLNDGGTRIYSALTYKKVIWYKSLGEIFSDGSVAPIGAYHRTSYYWFPDSTKDIDALWEIERADHDIYEYLIPEG